MTPRILPALVLLSAVAACGGAPTATPPTAPVTTAVVAPAPATSPSTPSTLTKPFGSTFTWDDGLSVTVSAPAPLKPQTDVSYQDKDSKAFVVIEVTFKNGATEPMSPGMLSLRGTTGSREAKRIFDSASGLELEPSAKVLPGREVKWKVAFGVDLGKPFTVQVDYGFDRKGGIYEASL